MRLAINGRLDDTLVTFARQLGITEVVNVWMSTVKGRSTARGPLLSGI